MSRFNAYMNGHFASCLKLADARDVHRQRDVKIYMLPGEFDVVGVSDGTDAWIAPVIADPFSVSIKRILDNVRAGKMPDAANLPRSRKALVIPPEQAEIFQALLAQGLSPTGRMPTNYTPPPHELPRKRNVVKLPT